MPIWAGDPQNLPAPPQVVLAPGRWAILNVEPGIENDSYQVGGGCTNDFKKLCLSGAK